MTTLSPAESPRDADRSPRGRRDDASRPGARGIVAVFAIVVVLGLVDLPAPLAGDQSLFLVFARQLARGAALYRDVWDLKQPGIFTFYELGDLGGAGALGVHLLELAILVAFAGVLVRSLRESPLLAPGRLLAPIFVVGWYYLVARPSEMTQIESLVGVPIYLLLAGTVGALRATRRRGLALAAGAGLAAGTAIVLKVFLVPLLVAIALVPYLVAPREVAWGRRLAVAAATLAAAALPVVVAILGLATSGVLTEAWWTTVVLPPEILRELPQQSGTVLRIAAVWFTTSYGAVVTLAVITIAAAVRSRDRDPLVLGLGVWVVCGFGTYLAQRTSWYDYQTLVDAVPLGIFAAAGARAAVRPGRTRTTSVLALIAVLAAIAPLRTFGAKCALLARDGFAAGGAALERYRSDVSLAYAGTRADAKLLPTDGDLYVIGHPEFYLATGRPQALVINGWTLGLLVAAQRASLTAAIRTHPPAYVYVSNDESGFRTLRRRSPAFAAAFDARYPHGVDGEFGTLYRRIPAATGAP